MADIPIDGKVKVAEVPTIADKSGPTVTELTAGVEIQTFLTPDGLSGFEPDTADVDTSSLASTFDTKTIGRDSFSNTMLKLKKQDADTVYDTMVRGYSTHVVVRRGIDNTVAWTAADEVEVYPVICGQVRNLPPEANSVQKYEVPVKIHEDPDIRAAVVGP